jgi:NAD(P)-dependent dehydrogenase (short-subunit alcohol dehydrogenase family)
MNDLFSLKGKVAIVTGAGRGLGQAMAIAMAEAGSDVAAADIISVDDTVNRIKKAGRKARAYKVDVGSKDSVDQLAAQVTKEFGRIDILVNNAGILRTGIAEDLSLDDWNAVLKVNLTGPFLCAQAVGRQMIAQKEGRIINISSVAGLLGSPTSAAYCASKAGVLLLTKTLALEWAKYNVLVNAICPGIFATDMTNAMIDDPQWQQVIKMRVPLGRYAKPEELGGAVVFLASQAAGYITGSAFVIDGGWTAGL